MVSPTFLLGSLLVFASLVLIFDLRLPGRLPGMSSPPVAAPITVDDDRS